MKSKKKQTAKATKPAPVGMGVMNLKLEIENDLPVQVPMYVSATCNTLAEAMLINARAMEALAVTMRPIVKPANVNQVKKESDNVQ